MSDKHYRWACAGLAALCLFTNTHGIRAAEADATCEIAGLTHDPDPQGTNVRSGPGTDYPIVATLPQFVRTNGESYSPEFTIRRFDKGWFEIETVIQGQYGSAEEVIFAGPGWISAKLVSMFVEGPALLAEPRAESQPTLLLEVPGHGIDETHVRAFHGCTGSFIEMTVQRPDGVKGRGWIEDVCANQVSPCS